MKANFFCYPNLSTTNEEKRLFEQQVELWTEFRRLAKRVYNVLQQRVRNLAFFFYKKAFTGAFSFNFVGRMEKQGSIFYIFFLLLALILLELFQARLVTGNHR